MGRYQSLIILTLHHSALYHDQVKVQFNNQNKVSLNVHTFQLLSTDLILLQVQALVQA